MGGLHTDMQRRRRTLTRVRAMHCRALGTTGTMEHLESQLTAADVTLTDDVPPAARRR
jgi:hypothetical protein